MAAKIVPPSITETAFNCPHCSTLTTQYWYAVAADQMKKEEVPRIWRAEEVEEFIESFTRAQRDAGEAVSKPQVDKFRKDALSDAAGVIRLVRHETYPGYEVRNLHLSRCYECDRVAIWHYDRLLWPVETAAPDASPDLPSHIEMEYHEAAAVLAASPRGAAALLRLCIERLCLHLLGSEAKGDLNADIGLLVGRGLDPRVQMALDVVRVIGNEAVHPGQIDLSDDTGTALELFRLVNLIVEIMISQPKHIAEMYAALPPGKLEAIENRNSRALAAPKKAQ